MLRHSVKGMLIHRPGLDAQNLNLKTKDGVVLVPQPSDNINDPYNW